MDIAWASDSTQLIAAGGNGATVLAQITDRILTWNKIEVKLVDPRKIHVHDVMNETLEEIEFARDRVIEMSVGYGYMIVYTATHDSYKARRIGTRSHIFDLQTTVILIVQSQQRYLTVDNPVEYNCTLK